MGTYTYDANGHMTQDSRTYVYNAENQLIQIVDGGVVIAQYEYNHDGLRSKKTAGSLTEYYYYDSVLGLVDDSGQFVVNYQYSSFGKIISSSGTVTTGDGTLLKEANPFLYSSYQYDIESGFYYLKSRYYIPSLGRSLNKDVIQGENIYVFCSNNPVTNEDPSGYVVIKRWMISTPIDMILMLIPGIGAAFAPIKALGKQYGKMALKTKVKTPLMNFIRFIANNASKLITGFKNIVSEIPGVGSKLVSKVPTKKLVDMIAGATSSATINKIQNVLIPNIDILLSIGGAISGILDYVFDKKLENSIWVV